MLIVLIFSAPRCEKANRCCSTFVATMRSLVVYGPEPRCLLAHSQRPAR